MLISGDTQITYDNAERQSKGHHAFYCCQVSYVRRSGGIRQKSHDLVLRYRHLKMGIHYTNEIFLLFSNERLSLPTTFPIKKVAEDSIVH